MTTSTGSFFLILFLMLSNSLCQAQFSSSKEAERRFTGLWLNKKTTRHLEISFENGHAIIIDWTSKFQKRESGDVYKALLKNGKLIMPEDKAHHAPYSEIILKNNVLIYLTRSFGPGTGSNWDKEEFKRPKDFS